MNESKFPLPGHPGPAPDKRRDGRSRELVDRALCIQRDASTLCALEYLKAHAIPSCVIARVLDPDRRRIPTVA